MTGNPEVERHFDENRALRELRRAAYSGPETALRCPTLRPKARKRGLVLTTAHFCAIQGHFQSFSKASSSRTRIVFPAARSSAAASGQLAVRRHSGQLIIR
jgi:hypothetical protein